MGALGALGAGLKSYGQSMQETERMNWLAKQDEVKFEREKNLEDLRASRAAKENQLNRDANRDNLLLGQQFQDRQLDKQQLFSAYQLYKQQSFSANQAAASERAANARLDKQQAFQLGQQVVGKDERGVNITLAQMEAMSDKEREKVMGPEAYEVQLQLNKQDLMLTQAKKFTEAERLEKANALRAIWSKDGLSATEEVKLVAMENGIDMKDILGTEKTMSADMVKNLDTVLSSNEEYINASPGEKISILKATYNKLASSSGGSGPVKIVYNKDVDIPKLLKMSPEEQQVAMDRIKANDIEKYREVSKDLAAASQSKPKSGALAGPSRFKQATDAVIGFAGRNMNGYQTKRDELKKKYPGMTDAFYDAKMN